MPTGPPMSSSSLSRPTETRTARRTETTVTDGRRLTYAEYGSPDGTPVVFLHGTPGSRLSGALFETAARDRGVRLLAPDRPGYGESAPWPTRSIADAGSTVGAVLDAAGVETAGLVAFSGGSPHALATAATHADRVDRVDLVAGATPPGVSESTPAVQRLLAGLATTTPPLLRGLFRGQAWFADRLDPSFVLAQYTADGTGTIPDAEAAIVKRDFLEAFARHRSGAVTEFRNTASDWGIEFAAIDVPVHCWHGTADTNVPVADARRFARTIPAAERHELEGADHLRTLLRSRRAVLDGHR